jgi:shikimate dehydrogenase
LDAVYLPLPCAPEHFIAAMRGLAALGFIGANVTVPHKVAAFAGVDHRTDAAALIGAVNTIRVEPDGTLTGHNTDCLGAVRALEQLGHSVAAGSVLVLGTGGAGRGVAVGAALAGAKVVHLLNRTREKAGQLAGELAAQPPLAHVRWIPGSLDQAQEKAGLPWSEIHSVFQTTSLGMKGGDPLPGRPDWLPPSCAVLEAVYSPLETDFLREARAMGLRTADGLSMLLEQGALAFEFWFGHAPDRRVMREALEAAVSAS